MWAQKDSILIQYWHPQKEKQSACSCWQVLRKTCLHIHACIVEVDATLLYSIRYICFVFEWSMAGIRTNSTSLIRVIRGIMGYMRAHTLCVYQHALIHLRLDLFKKKKKKIQTLCSTRLRTSQCTPATFCLRCVFARWHKHKQYKTASVFGNIASAVRFLCHLRAKMQA